MYENEVEVGEAVRQSGVPRSEVFVSKCYLEISMCNFHLVTCLASKIASTPETTYESTIKGVDESLARFKFGASCRS